MIEFCCDACLYSINGTDMQTIPRDRFSLMWPQMTRRKSARLGGAQKKGPAEVSDGA